MLGQTLRHSSRQQGNVSRELERYPRGLVADFRKCDVSTLRRIGRRFKLECASDSSKAELARLIARHYQKELVVKEDLVLKRFVSYTTEYATRGQVSGRSNKRYGTRSARGNATGDDSDMTGDEDRFYSGQPLYCICNRISFGEMIGCDNDDCTIEWFHVGCVGVKPGSIKGQVWYCPICREKKQEKSNTKKQDDDPKKKGGDSGSAGAKRAGPAAPKRERPETPKDGSGPAKRKKGSGDTPEGAKKKRARASGGEGNKSGSDAEDESGAKSNLTYSEMISRALQSFENHTASFKEICDKMEQDYSEGLNWKAESEIRKSPVWKSSVRKILLSNQRFQKADANNYVLVAKN